jgi:transposase
VNLAGALCLETGDCQIVEDVRITSETTIALFAKVERANPHKRLIHVILDRAGTHRGQALQDWLARPGCRIRPIYLPAYAPNLNAIERRWKLMHQHVTHNRYYPDFRTFAEAVMRFFKTTLPREWKLFRDTITDNFHIVRPEQFRVDG